MPNNTLSATPLKWPLLLILLCSASARRLETAHGAQRGWRLQKRADAEAILEVVVAIKQENVRKLKSVALAVSDPTSPQYGHHLSLADVHALVRPSNASLEVVHKWLGPDFESVTPNGDMVRARIPVWRAEALLNTSYGLYRHESTGMTIMRVIEAYSLPDTVADAVDFVSPTLNFITGAKSKAKAVISEASNVGGGYTTPAVLRELYNMADTDIGRATSNNSQAVVSFLQTYYSAADLQTFWAKYPPLAKTLPLKDVPATQPHTPVDLEAALDTQYLTAMGAGINTEVWTIEGEQPGSEGNEPFLAWLLQVSSTEIVPDVFSISYGDDEDQVQEEYAHRCNTEFAKAAARGISLLAASGDDGAGCGGVYSATFPASSPWVTAVGGLRESYSTPPEEVWPKGGGGFSNYFTVPDWQASAIAGYLESGSLPEQHYWNRDGAAFPDVSGHAESYDVCVDGDFRSVGGTSAACPSVAGLFATLNQVRLDAGKSKLGFLSPLIYLNADAFTDVTSGYNLFCGSRSAFPATSGWDAASGFGYPNFGLLKDVVLAL